MLTRTPNPLPFSTWIPAFGSMDSAIKFYGLNPDPKLKLSLKIQRDIDFLIKFIVNTVRPNDIESNREDWLDFMEHLQLLCKEEKSFSQVRFPKVTNELYFYLYENDLHFKLKSIIDDLKKLNQWQNSVEC